jgi:glycosyltransferase involved in cell wall biosynthesis
MKILISTAIFPNRAEPTRGTYILNQAIALARRHEVRVISPVPYFPAWLRNGRYASITGIPDTDVIHGIHADYPRFVIIPKVFRFLHGHFLSASVWGHYRRVAGEFQPDVILGFSAYPDGAATVRLGRRLGIPTVIGCIGNDINQKARGGIQRHLIAEALKASDLVLTVCRDLKHSVERLGIAAGKIVVVPNGIERDSFGMGDRNASRRRLGLPDQRRIVLCVSRLSEEKGIDVLLRAFGRTTTPDTVLYIAGEGLHRPILEKIRSESPRRNDITFLGAISHADVPMWLAAADLFVLPSRTEGHPNSLLEAYACGLPAVATRVGGVPEVVTSEEIGLLVDSDDVDGMARAIDSALARSWDRRRIIELAGSRTWDDVASEIVAQLEALLSTKTPSSRVASW